MSRRTVVLLWMMVLLCPSLAVAADAVPALNSVLPPEAKDANMPQQMEGFNLSGYSDAGAKAWDIKGDTADIDAAKVAVTKVNANSYGQEDTNLKAEKGVINKTTGDVHLENNVVITSQSGATMKTDTLDWARNKDLVRTDDKVELQNETMKVDGTGMEAHPSLKAATLQSDVTANIQSEGKDKTKDNRIQITSDGPMEMDQNTQTAVFTENVVAVEMTSGRTLTADKMVVRFNATTQKIQEITCTGHVSVKQGNNVTYSEGLVYKADEQKIVLTGRPKLIIDPGDHSTKDTLSF
ncbi:MAG: LPS export ABC transporter periplasmic protein LptC [Candidatus Omnitrophica bacterium]|nr:LPS export ABC transporter periplasmic protein LptC [Candidatus Omnitrophota bacterium]